MKKILFNKPYVKKKDKRYIDEVFSSNKFSDGIYQKKCEKLIKKKIKSKFVALTQNCTSALEIAMILINLKRNDEVIMPSYTFTSTANSVILRGAKPVFVDVNKHDINLDPHEVEKKITKRTKAIIVVHYGGVSCDMEKFLRLKRKYNLYLIEDAAHSFMGKFKKRFLGTIGDFGAFSFHETKNYVGGQCGALSINNQGFINRANILMDKGTDRALISDKKKYYSWKDIGSEFRSAELPAALLFSQLLRSSKIQLKRKNIWNFYYKNFSNKNNKNFYILSKNKLNTNAHHVFVIIFKSYNLRERFITYMKKRGITCYFHYYPLHLSTFGKKFSKIKLKNTERIYDGLVRLPLYPSLNKNEIKRVISEVNKFLKII